MWIISIPEVAEHNLSTHERWLRPGSTFSIGRSADNDLSIASVKSLSKQHVQIKLGNVPQALTTKIPPRTQVTVCDLSSKFGSHLSILNSTEDVISVQQEYKVTTDEIQLRLGKAQFEFRIFWRPIVIALSNVKLEDVRKQCDLLDIRYSKEYLAETTHVVTSKYNTPKTLQALLEQKWIVGVPYIRALANQADDMAKQIQSLPDVSWSSYLPQDEYSQLYGHAAFLPKAGRELSFAGLKFVFFEKKQCQALTAAIMAGSGQVLEYTGHLDKHEISSYLTSLLRAIVVMPRDDLYIQVLEGLLPTLGVSSLTQGDFLAVIMSNGEHDVHRVTCAEPRNLPSYKHVSVEQDIQDRSSGPVLREEILSHAEQSVAADKPRRIGSRSVKALPTFEDDLFGAVEILESTEQASLSRRNQLRPDPVASQMFTADDGNDLFNSSLLPGTSTQVSSNKSSMPRGATVSQAQVSLRTQEDRKRRIGLDVTDKNTRNKRAKLSTMNEDTYVEEDFEAAPAAAALAQVMKQTVSNVSPADSKSLLKDKEVVPKKKPEQTREITEEEIQKTLLANKERAEKQTQVLEDEDSGSTANEELRNLGVVEYFAVNLPEDHSSSDATLQHRSDRWDPRWNGRKNFKAFRRAVRGGHNIESRQPKIMIRLLEARTSDRGLMDQSWLETATTRNNDVIARQRNINSTGNRDFAPIHTLAADGTQALTNGLTSVGHSSQHLDARSPDPSQTRSQFQNRQSSSHARPAPRTGTRSKQNTLFVNEASDSDEDPLRFKL